jgi:GH35 family endo-1,4-beta-xylanase
MTETRDFQWNRRQVLVAATGLALSTRLSFAAASGDVRCLIFDYEGKPLGSDAMKRFHLCDLKMRPFTLEPKITTGEIQFTPPANRPFRIALPLKVPTFGEVFVYADNQGQGYTPQSLGKASPLVLNYAFAVDRMATVRNLAADCAKQSVDISPDLQRRIDAAGASLKRAQAAKGDQAALVRYSNESLRDSLWAGDLLCFARAKARIARSGARPGFLFGCNGFTMDNSDFRRTFAALFNYTTMPIYRGWVEPVKGHPDYSHLDHLLDSLAGTQILPKIHPLVWLQTEATPQWEKNLSYDETKKIVVSRVRESVGHFRLRGHVYDVVNEAHVQPEANSGMAGFTREQNVDLTVSALNAAREIDQTCFRIINVTGTWADYYMAHDPLVGQQSPYDYYAMMRDAKADYETIGLQYYHSGRCLVECERDIETFEDFGKPIHITELGFPSSPKLDPDLSFGGGGPYWGGGPGGANMVWHGDTFTEDTQAEWAEQFYTIAYANPRIRAISWWDMQDWKSAAISYGALVRRDGTPKESYKRLQALFAKWHEA